MGVVLLGTRVTTLTLLNKTVSSTLNSILDVTHTPEHIIVSTPADVMFVDASSGRLMSIHHITQTQVTSFTVLSNYM
jgi:hypothetical protein